MLRNHCVDYLRHKNVVDKYTLHYVAKIKGEERLYNYDFSYNNSEHPFLYQELEKQIQNVIDRLPERCREIFLMSRIDGLKNREIAAKLQISTQAVEKHIGKAIRILSEQLEKNDSIYLRIIILSLIISSGA
jgi:RNA polymerase sigma-70 factor (ECF subfamily)